MSFGGDGHCVELRRSLRGSGCNGIAIGMSDVLRVGAIEGRIMHVAGLRIPAGDLTEICESHRVLNAVLDIRSFLLNAAARTRCDGRVQERTQLAARDNVPTGP